MRYLTNLLLLAALGFFLSQSALAQPGGGGGFGGGGFGGGGGRGGGGFGGGGGGFGGGGFGEEEEQQPETPLSELIPGRWEIEFRIDYFSADPEAIGRYLEVEADIFIMGDRLEGRIRERDLIGDFRCMYDGHDRCQFGTMRFQGEDQDWQDFSFVVDRFGQRAEGWAEWINVETGEIQRYELRLRKR